jgi:peptide/nickel transport system permease protein
MKLKSNARRNKIHPYIITGGILFGAVLLVAIFASHLAPYDPLVMEGKDRLLKPSMDHFMGTDNFGRDIMSRVFYGARVSIEIGFIVTILSTFIGGFVGLVAGSIKWLDNILMRILDGLLAFPGIIIAIILSAISGAGKGNIILALSFAYFPTMARVLRASVLVVKEQDYVESAIAIGAKKPYILIKYILANSLAPMLVQMTFIFALAILDEAALSFLGVGIEPPAPSLGGMITEARTFMSVAPWQIFFPGIAIVISVLGLNLIGDGLRDVLDPRLKQSRG